MFTFSFFSVGQTEDSLGAGTKSFFFFLQNGVFKIYNVILWFSNMPFGFSGKKNFQYISIKLKACIILIDQIFFKYV